MLECSHLLVEFQLVVSLDFLKALNTFMQLDLKVLTILDGKLLNTNLSIRHISTSISLFEDLLNEMPLVSRLSAFNSLELFVVVEPSKHIFFSLGTHIVYLRSFKILFRLVYFVKLLLETL